MIALTFDTDYVWPEDIARFVETFPIPGAGTFFLWQPLPGFDLGSHELGPHPFLTDTRPWLESIHEFEQAWGRKGTTIRPHSCVYSHLLGVHLAQRGYKAISQATFLFQDGLRPYRHPWGIWELPIYYMDSMDFTLPRNWPGHDHRPFDRGIIRKSVESDSLFVYSLHPLHILMNIGSYEQYQSARERIVSRQLSPFELSFPGRGSRTFYEELLQVMGDTRQRSYTCEQVIAQQP